LGSDTYAVGELSALNGVMEAKAERSCVFHLVGMPTTRHQRVRKIIHHTLGDGEFQEFANISEQASCVSSVITPDNCYHEMERLIATARAESRPAYILVASDYAVTPVTACDPVPHPRPKSGPDLAKAVAAIAERIEAARSLAVFPAYTVSQFKLSAGPAGATLGIALADPSRRTVLFTGEGSHQMTAADIGTMARNGLKPVIFVLNNAGYMVERALEANPDWVYNDLAPWDYHKLPAALGCRGWFTAKVTTLGELDAALARAATGESASYIEVVGSRMDFPAGLAMAHERLDAMYGDG
jgi:TPP-dependent 2-oxoacid decarboxylase